MPRPPSSARRRADIGDSRVGAGRIAGAFGLGGELKVDASRVGDDALRAALDVTLRYDDGTERAATIAAVRRHKGRPLVRIAGVDDATAAEALGRPEILLARDDAPLGEGEYFDDDLVGCRLIDETGADLGTVAAVAHYPSQDMLVVGRTRTLLPLVRAFVARVDVARKEILVTVPPGLLDPEAADEA